MDSDASQTPNIDDDTLQRIEDRVLREEKDQLSYNQAYNIIPALKEIVEEEIPEIEPDSELNNNET